MYEVETRVLNQSVKRNIKRFPTEFMFQLCPEEWKEISSSHFAMMKSLPKNRTGSYLPFAFTEHGVTMLVSVLRSDKAIAMNIAIVKAFISLRTFALLYAGLREELAELKNVIGEHDLQLSQIYAALESLLEDKNKKQLWEEKERIGFKQSH